MTKPLSLMVVDDHVIFRRGVVELLSEYPDLDVVGEASNGADAVQMALRLQPDVVLMDVHMPEGDGIEAVSALKQEADIRVLMLTVSEEDKDLQEALLAGAQGYLLKNTEPEDLRAAIHAVAQGKGALSPEITPRIVKAAARNWGNQPETHLSPREQEVLVLLARGATTRDIANTLVISTNTVKTHVQRILNKLDAGNRAEAVARAAELGLLP